VTPVQFTGTPAGQDVVKVCNLPIVAQPNSPAVVDINSPPQNAGTIFHSSTDNGWFAVELRLTQSKPPLVTFFERSHPSSPPPAPYSSVSDQFHDTPGIEAVVMQGPQLANIYCYLNSQGDSDLTTAGGSSLTHVSVYWVRGPCGLTDQTQLPAVCTAYSANPLYSTTPFELSAILPAHLGATQSKTAVNLCGCNGSVPRFCDPSKAAGTAGSCNPTGEAFNGLQTFSVGTSGAASCFTYNLGGTWIQRCN